MASEKLLENLMMAWPVTDFDGVQFNDGSGYAEVVAIHLAIKERAEAVGHSLASGDYADEWDTSLVVWHDDNAPDDGRLYLVDVLQKFYNDIVSLLTIGTGKAWVQSPEIGASTWGITNLKADIGLGDFADLLTGTTNYEAFLWLHEALDRLVYVREIDQVDTSDAVIWFTGYLFGYDYGGAFEGNAGWEDMAAGPEHYWSDPTNTLYASLMWRLLPGFGGGFATAIRRVENLKTRSDITGSVEAVALNLTFRAGENTGGTTNPYPYEDPSTAMELSINGEQTRTLATFFGQETELLTLNAENFPSETDNTIYMEVLTPTPGTSPFWNASGGTLEMGVRMFGSQMYYYIDISGELADQAA